MLACSWNKFIVLISQADYVFVILTKEQVSGILQHMQKIFYLELEKQNNDQKRVLSAHADLVLFWTFWWESAEFCSLFVGINKMSFCKIFSGIFHQIDCPSYCTMCKI